MEKKKDPQGPGTAEIQQKLGVLKEMRQKCIDEKRLPTDDEKTEAERLLRKIDELEKENEAWLREPAEPPDKTPIDTRDISARGGDDIPYELRMAGDKKDFRSLYGTARDEYRWTDKESTFFQALFSGRHHPGLKTRAMDIQIPSSGGFLVPTEYSEKIHNVSLENELVMPLATVQPMRSNELKLPGVDIGDHSSNLFGGFTASYTAEAGTLTEANPKIRQMTLVANKLTGFLKFSNELMADAPNGEKQILDICGKGLAWYRDKSWLKGSGAGEPLGVLSAGCTLIQAKETGQSASTIVYENLIGMLGKLHSACFKNSVWVCHQSTIPQLLQLSIAVGTGGSFIPVLSEKNGQFTILTRPVIFTEKTEVLGSQGDVLLADFSQYIIGLREEMRIDLSQHVYFTTDQGAARLIERHDGQPLWDEALTLEDGSTEVSPFVVLAARS